MSRWEPGAQERLEEAALDLYVDQGFERTTVAEIAARAGVTERTFFRYFADKREVLFSGSRDLERVVVAAVLGAPSPTAPIHVVAAALQTAAETFFDGRRERARRRQGVIDRNAGLQEREAAKLSALAAAMTRALQTRGVTDPEARLVAEAGVVVLKVSFDRWLLDPGAPLQAVLAEHVFALTRALGTD